MDVDTEVESTEAEDANTEIEDTKAEDAITEVESTEAVQQRMPLQKLRIPMQKTWH